MSRELTISCDVCGKPALPVSVETRPYTDAAGSPGRYFQEADLCHQHSIEMLEEAMKTLYVKMECALLFNRFKFKETR